MPSISSNLDLKYRKENSMTDKEKIIAEVERLRNEFITIYAASPSRVTTLENMAKAALCKQLLSFIDSMQEKPVSEDLEEASYRFACKCSPLKTEYSISSPNPEVMEAFKAGAKWQREQDQSTIELAEDHAMLAGMKKMKEEMMAKAIYAVVSQVPCSNEIILYNPSSVDRYYLPQEMNKLGLNKGDKVKLVIIKDD